MSYAFTLTTVIKAPPQAVYDAWLDSRTHSAMTGGKATQSAQVGAEVTAWDGYISGRNVRLVPGKLIVQTWRTTKFAAADADSTITVDLAPANGGTCLTLIHADVPDGQTSYEESGWQTHYFAPMQKFFGKGARKPAPAAKKKAAAKKTAKKTKRVATKKRAAKPAKRAKVKRKTKKR